MRYLSALLGLTLATPAIAHAQRPVPDRPREDRRVFVDDDRAGADGPSYHYRYNQDRDDDEDIRAFRRGAPQVRCGGYDGRDRDRCERRAADIEREDARWRHEAREREQKFEREMAERERDFRAKEMERWRKHRREMAEKWGDLD